MDRMITCYVYDKESTHYVVEYLVTVGFKQGYTLPTDTDINELEEKLTAKLHKSVASLRKVATWTPFDLAIEIAERGPTKRDEISASLQAQADQYDADSVKHLR